MIRHVNTRLNRPGFVMPGLAIFLMGLFAFVALAVDIGMIAVARTQCQNAADVAALAGCRNLNNKPGSTDNNRANALTSSGTAVTNNKLLNVNFTSAQVTSKTAGVYSYNTTSKTFLPSFPTTPPNGQSWTAMRVVVNVNQPTYFAKVLGFDTMPTGAIATAVYRPRDIAFALDMTGSMAYASTTNSASSTGYVGSMDPNTLAPSFGHYSDEQSVIIGGADKTDTDGQAFSRTNLTITTPNGPPIIRNFYFDPSNISSPATTVTTPAMITDTSDPANPRQRPQSNAFHRANVTETAGNPSTFTGPTYNFSSYNPNANSATDGPTPAPDFYGTQSDSGTQIYSGDRWRRLDGRIYSTATSWTSATTRAAGNAIELLGYTASGGNVLGGSTTLATELQFRDPIWEANGYDLDIGAYRTWKSGSNSNRPGNPGAFSTLLPSADRFKGYSMGPGYWGKTFFIWPPDPRAANDWRRKFFLTSAGAALDPEADNSTSTTGTNAINQVLLRTTADSLTLNNGGFTVNYAAILTWLKSGPQTLPPNLRAGRVVYYTSIPSDVNTGVGTDAEKLDKVFWREYIDWVLAQGYTSTSYLFGGGDSWVDRPTTVTTSALTTWTGPSGTWTASRPYMRYSDSPNRPRLHFWFGPLSMVDFISRAAGTGDNWRPGTCYEAQNWQLKAAMNSVIDDIRNNHPNDTVGMAMFSYPNHYEIRTPMSQDYTAHKNALFYPKSLLSLINGGDTTSEFRPYNTSLSGYVNNEIPNADGSTDPNTGLALAFNLLSPSATLDTATYGAVKGRRGASKLVIFETDGVPNAYRSLTLNKAGYDTYYTVGATMGAPGNGDATVMSEAYSVVQQMVKTMSSTNTGGTDSGLSLPNAPCKVYSIGFGDLFDTVLAPSATFRPTALQFLAQIQIYGGTSATGATTIPSSQIITGQYQTRIDTLKTCMERIFSSGVTVSLIE